MSLHKDTFETKAPLAKKLQLAISIIATFLTPFKVSKRAQWPSLQLECINEP